MGKRTTGLHADAAIGDDDFLGGEGAFEAVGKMRADDLFLLRQHAQL